MTLQLYLHFPFCKRKCFYCDFFSAEASEAKRYEYAILLEKEIRLAAKIYPDAKVSTLFLGGGTPSFMPVKAMERVWQALRECFDLLPNAEYTVEANPGTLKEEWLERARYYGVNRLSLGIQAAQDGLLKAVGRVHSFQEARESVAMARACAMDSVNGDVMFGLPEQTRADYLETLEAVAALRVDHISAYSLIVEPETQLFHMVEKKEKILPAEEETTEMYQQGLEWLEKQGYAQYEISNFAKPGRECKHNLGYWQGAWYLGLGVNAHSMLPSKNQEMAYGRRENTRDMRVYRESLEQGRLPISQEMDISPKEAMFETMMLGLRTTRGVSLEDFQHRHGISLMAAYGEKLSDLAKEGLGNWQQAGQEGSSFALSRKGLLLQNAVLLRLME